MNREEAVEGIKRHAEAILNLAKEVGISDYVDVAVIDGSINLTNSPYSRHQEDGLGFDLYHRDGEWRDIFEIVLRNRSNG